jgi:hypothetical protein
VDYRDRSVGCQFAVVALTSIEGREEVGTIIWSLAWGICGALDSISSSRGDRGHADANGYQL